MGFKFNSGSYKSYADNNAKAFGGYSSPAENFAAGVGQVVDEELSISKWLFDDGIDERNQNIRNMIKDGIVEKSAVDMYTTRHQRKGTKVDYEGLVNYLNWTNSLPDKLKTGDELISERYDELTSRRKYREEVYDTSLTGGKVSAFLGSMAASTLDPINVATMGLAVPMAGAKAVSKSMYALTMAKRTAALNVAVSLPIEPFVHSWKEEIGAEYTIEDSLFNIGAAGVLGGSIGGVAALVGRKFVGNNFLTKDRESLAKNMSYDDMVVEFKKAGSEGDDAEIMARFVDEANQATDPNMSAEEFVRKTENSQSGMDAGNKSDVRPIESEETDLKAQFDRPEVKEGEVQKDTRETVPADNSFVLPDGTKKTFRSEIEDIDAEVEYLSSKLDCLNG